LLCGRHLHEGREAFQTVRELGLPNILFNNAGADTEGKLPMIEISEEAFDRAVEVNLKGPWLVMKYAVPRMIEAGGGSIINTAPNRRLLRRKLGGAPFIVDGGWTAFGGVETRSAESR
jgi:NAD(P)-dependent dehydrogenase (short-subunit alcohol dehydrogenase family)